MKAYAMKMVCLCALLLAVGLVRARAERLVAQITVADRGSQEQKVTRTGASLDELLRNWAAGSQYYKVRSITITNGHFTVYDWHKLRSLSNSLSGIRSFTINAAVQVDDIPDNMQERNPLLRHCSRVEIRGLRSVGKNAFDEARIEEIILPNTLKVGQNAFYGCGRLRRVEVPQLQEIGTSAFRSCSMLNTITLPNVRTIANSAFKACLALTYLKLNVTDGLRVDNSGESRKVPYVYPVFSECPVGRVVVPCDAQGNELRGSARIAALAKLPRTRLQGDPANHWQGFAYSNADFPRITIEAKDAESQAAGTVFVPASFEAGKSLELRPFLQKGYTLASATVSYQKNGRQVDEPIEGRTFQVPRTGAKISWTAKRNRMKMLINQQSVEASSISEGLERMHLTPEGVTSFELLEGSLEEWGWHELAEMKNATSIRIRPTVDYCAPGRSTVSPWGTTLKWTKLQVLELSKLEHVRYTTLMLSGLQGNDDLQLEMFPNIRTIEPGGLRHEGKQVRVVGMPANPPTYTAGRPSGGDLNSLGSIGKAFLVPMDEKGEPLEGQKLEAALDRYAKAFSNGNRSQGWNGRSLVWYRVKVDPAASATLMVNSPLGIYNAGEDVQVSVEGTNGKLPKVYYTDGGARKDVNNLKFTMPRAHITLTADWRGVKFSLGVKTGILHGRVSTEPSREAEYNSTVTINCTPDSDYEVRDGSVTFTYRDPASGETKSLRATKSAENKYTFVMPPADVEVACVFDKLGRYRIQQDPSMRNGSVRIAPMADDYAVGSNIVLLPSPSAGYVQEPGTSVEYALTSALNDWKPVTGNTLRMPASDIVVRAHFGVNQSLRYKVTINPRYANGQITAEPSGEIVAETRVRLHLKPLRGQRFKNLRYYKGSSQQGQSYPIASDQFIMPASDVYVTGDVEVNPNAKWSVTIDPSVPAGCLSATPNTKLEAGERVHVNRDYDPDKYTLTRSSVSWRLKDDPSSSWTAIDDTWSFVMPDGNVLLTAEFKEIPKVGYTVQQDPTMRNGHVKVMPVQDSYTEGTVLQLTAVPAPGYMLKPGEKIEYALTSALTDFKKLETEFRMPASNVVVRALFVADPSVKYNIKVDPALSGHVTTNPSERASVEDQVHLMVNPPRAMKVANLRYCKGDAPAEPWIRILNNQFQMPASNVYVTGEIVDDPNARHTVFVDPSVPNGFLSATPSSKLTKGEIVRLQLNYDAERYELVPGSVKWRLKEALPPQWVPIDASWSFIMPDGDVMLIGEFKEIPKKVYRIQQDPAMVLGEVKAAPMQDSYEEGTAIKFEAVPKAGYMQKEGTSVEYALTSALTDWKPVPEDFTMPAQDIVVRAHFDVDPSAQYSVVIDPELAAYIKADPHEGLRVETLVRLTLTPQRGQRFKEVRYCLGTEPMDPWTVIENKDFRMPASSVYVTGELEENPDAKWSVTIDPSVPEGCLTASPNEKIERGEVVRVQPTHDPNVYDLELGSLKWSLKDANPPEWTPVDALGTFVMPDGNVVIKGEFKSKMTSYETFTVTKEVDGMGTLSVLLAGEPLVSGTQVRSGAELEIAAEPVPGYVLSKVTLNDDDPRWESKFTYVVRSNTAIKAYFVVSVDNVTDVATQHALVVSPNPFGDVLHVQGEGLKRVTLYSAMGVEMLRTSQGFESIATQHLPAGVYLLRAEWHDGAVTTHRLVHR